MTALHGAGTTRTDDAGRSMATSATTAPGPDVLLSRLHDVRKAAAGWTACCPAHADKRPSLKIDTGDDGKILLKCHTGCTNEQIVAAVGLTMADLFPPRAGTNGHHTMPERRTRWGIRDVDGTLIAEHERIDKPNGKKSMPWYLPGATEPGLEGKVKPVDMPLYNSERLRGLDDGAVVVVCEGEKAADALPTLGVPYVALATTCGAASTPSAQVLAWIARFDVILWPDADEPGRQHMRRIAARLLELGCAPRWFDWPAAPPKGDAADWPGTGGELCEALVAAPAWTEKPADEFVHSSTLGDGVVDESIFRVRTAREEATMTPPDVDWVARPWLARGAITELVGPIKRAGKTTWCLALCKAITTGAPFLGEPTEAGHVLYLTEQGFGSFQQALRRAGLADSDHLHIMHWHETIGHSWDEVAAEAVKEAVRLGVVALMVDTLGQFAGLKGDGENTAGEAMAAVRPLQEAASAHGLAVLVIRHERKSGGEVGDSGRGSSAFGGAVDIILSLRRSEGNTRPTVRTLSGIGRFDGTPESIAIELIEGVYQSLGNPGEIATNEARALILANLATGEAYAIAGDALVSQVGRKRSTIYEALQSLVSDGRVATIGKGKKGNPRRYYLPSEHEINSSTTPSPRVDEWTHSESED